MLHKLVYLSNEVGLPGIPKALKHYVPYYDLLMSISTNGITSAALMNDVPTERLERLYLEGKDSYPNGCTPQDIRAILTKIIYTRIEDDKAMAMGERLSLYHTLQTFNQGISSLVESDIGTFVGDGVDTLKVVPSGFAPIDYLNGIMPHTLMLIGAHSGSGKTSIMLSISDSIAKQHIKRVVFVSLEMTRNAVASRARHLALKASADNVIIAGQTSLQDLDEYCTEDTILVIDYADLLLSKYGSETRLDIASIYANLLRMSKRCFLLITATQLNRDATISLNSLSESSYKSFYSESIYALVKGGLALGDSASSTVSLVCLKHRYAMSGNKCSFNFNYETLQVTSEPTSGEVLSYDMEI